MKKVMKKILNFSIAETFSTRKSYVEVYENTETGVYLLSYKYASMKKKDEKLYNTYNMVMYDAQRKIMFLLS